MTLNSLPRNSDSFELNFDDADSTSTGINQHSDNSHEKSDDNRKSISDEACDNLQIFEFDNFMSL